MKFTITNFQLLHALSLSDGFTAKSAQRPILMNIHVVADVEKQKVMFESTNSTKAVRWDVDAKVEGAGDCLIDATKYMFAPLKSYKKIIDVTIYNDGGLVKADFDGNTIKLNIDTYGEYPKLSGVFDFELLDVKPIFEINALQSSLKSFKDAGVRYVEFSFADQNKSKKVKLIGMDELQKPVFEAIMLSCRSDHY